MTNPDREALSAQPDTLDALRQLAQSQGRPLDAVLDDALREYLARHQRGASPVGDAFALSLDEFDALYQALAR